MDGSTGHLASSFSVLRAAVNLSGGSVEEAEMTEGVVEVDWARKRSEEGIGMVLLVSSHQIMAALGSLLQMVQLRLPVLVTASCVRACVCKMYLHIHDCAAALHV